VVLPLSGEIGGIVDREGAKPLLLEPQFTCFRSSSGRGCLNTPTHTFQPKSFRVVFYKLFIFYRLVAASLPALRVHLMQRKTNRAP